MCRKQDVIALSTAESEFVAITETCKELMWTRALMKDLGMEIREPSVIRTDSQSCMAMIENHKFSNRSKHIDTKNHFVKDHIEKGTIRLNYVPTDKNIADLMTKPLGPQKVAYFRTGIGLADKSHPTKLRRSVEYQ